MFKQAPIFLILFFAALSYTASGQLKQYSEYDFTKSYLKKNNIKGKVKRMNEIHVSIERSPNAWGYLYSYHEFDPKGNLLKISQFDDVFGEITNEINFIYNQTGNLIESRNSPFKYILDSIYLDTAAMVKDTFIYNIKGMLVSMQKYKEGKIIGGLHLNYNKAGQIIEEANASLGRKTVWNYDSNNVIIEYIYINSNSGYSYLPNVVNTFNRKGKILLHQERNNSTLKTFSRIDSFMYEEHGRKVTDASYVDGVLNWKNISYYNKNMQIVKMQYYNSENKFTDEINYTVDKEDNIVMMTATENHLNNKFFGATMFTNIDKKGNWVNAISGSSMGYTIKRSIEYYK